MRGRTLLIALTTGCCVVLGAIGPAIAHGTPAGVTDAEALGIYVQVNGFDVETALLGRAQAASPAVRELATQVAVDHIGVRQAAFDLAVKCKVSPVLPSSRNAAAIEHGRAMTRLAALKGASFDPVYLQHEAAFHRAAIDAVRQVLEPSATCPALKAHFKEILPALEHHLSVTEELARALPTR
jgi:putative membrane protein